jgi:hypothetical protein
LAWFPSIAQFALNAQQACLHFVQKIMLAQFARIEDMEVMTYTIHLEQISTGIVSPSMLVRKASEAEARAYAQAAIAGYPDLRIARIEAR